MIHLFGGTHEVSPEQMEKFVQNQGTQILRTAENATPISEGTLIESSDGRKLIFNPSGPDPLQLKGYEFDLPEETRGAELGFAFGGQPVIYDQAQCNLPVIGFNVPGGPSFNIFEEMGLDVTQLGRGLIVKSPAHTATPPNRPTPPTNTPRGKISSVDSSQCRRLLNRASDSGADPSLCRMPLTNREPSASKKLTHCPRSTTNPEKSKPRNPTEDRFRGTHKPKAAADNRKRAITTVMETRLQPVLCGADVARYSAMASEAIKQTQDWLKYFLGIKASSKLTNQQLPKSRRKSTKKGSIRPAFDSAESAPPPAEYARYAEYGPPAESAPPPAEYARYAEYAPPAESAPPPAEYARYAEYAPPAEYARYAESAPPAEYARYAESAPPAEYAPPTAEFGRSASNSVTIIPRGINNPGSAEVVVGNGYEYSAADPSWSRVQPPTMISNSGFRSRENSATLVGLPTRMGLKEQQDFTDQFNGYSDSFDDQLRVLVQQARTGVAMDGTGSAVENTPKISRREPISKYFEIRTNAGDDSNRTVEVVDIHDSPRVKLIRGFLDSGEAAKLMELISRVEALPHSPVRKFERDLTLFKNNLLADTNLPVDDQQLLELLMTRMSALTELDSNQIVAVCPSVLQNTAIDDTKEFSFISRIYLEDSQLDCVSEFPHLGISISPKQGALIQWAAKNERGFKVAKTVHSESIVPGCKPRVFLTFYSR